MNFPEALSLLGLTEVYEPSREAVMVAYRDAVRAAHPDTAPECYDRNQAANEIKELQEARDVLLHAIAKRDNACQVCSGTGMVQGRIGVRRCDACAGTGDRR